MRLVVSHISKARNGILIALSASTLFFYLIQILKFDPDVHHDGIMFTPAVAFAEGYFPNRDFFSYYGPGSPIIQGLVIKIFGAQLFNLRVLSAVVLTITYILVYKYLERYIPKIWASLITILTVVPVASTLPWSSEFTTLLNLCSLFLLVKSCESKNNIKSGLLAFCSSSILSIAFYFRIHEILVWCTVTIYIFMRQKTNFFYWVSGFFMSHVGVLLYLHYNHALIPFIEDCILYPQSVAIIKSYTLAFFVGLAWYPLLTLCVFLALNIFKLFNTKSFFFRTLFFALNFALGYLFFFVSTLPREGNISYRNPKIVLIDGSWMLNVITGYFSATMAVVLCIYFLLSKFWKLRFPSPVSDDRNREAIIVSLSYAIGVLPQLYPMYDRLHLWMISPSLILPASIFLHHYLSVRGNLLFPAIGIAILIFTLQIFTIHQYVSLERISLKPKVLQGMEATKDSSARISPTVVMLQKYGEKNFTFNCNNALYAAASGKYLSIDKYFINWPGVERDNSRILGKYTFICNLSPDEFLKIKLTKNVIDFKALRFYENGDVIMRYNLIVRN